ncbi:hypothetical protein RND81_10G137600 [Saponaria officinalis]|uniref:Protein FAR1-RELATED SEQUENCE n=1 Tax=Saponaria officinalis TaxID=3572 RepID=A0AAW1I2E7_SAPOF
MAFTYFDILIVIKWPWSQVSFEAFDGDQVDYNPLFSTNLRFTTRGKDYEWAQKIASENGFSLVKANSGRKNRSQPKLFASYFRCSRYGSSKVVYDPDKPKRKSKTVKCRCLFRIRAVENYHVQDNKRLVLWNIITANGFGYHNHQPTKYKDGHRHYAGLNEEEKAYVRQQYRAAVFPRDIKSGLHQKTPDKPQPSSSQIYSETSKIRKEMRRERNTAQQMLALAVDANYVHWHQTNPDTHELTHVFMSHPEAVKLFRAYPHVVLIDSTYKTNTYNMALVECTGAAPTCFVTDRELELVCALRTLFPETPHLLCRWHMNRAIESRALKIQKKVYIKDHVLRNPESRWWNVIDATCEEDFVKAWSVFSEKWKRMGSYISRTWGEHAKKFVLCYTNEYFHLGNTATSRVESAHSLLKAWLKSAHLTLDTMWSRIHSMLEAQHSKIRKELEDSMSRPRITHRLFSLLQGNVSTKAIEIMEDEVRRGVALGIGLELGCGCVLPTTHSLPCASSLIDLKSSDSRVHLSDIHPFWRTLEYENEEAMPKNDNEMLEELVDKARKSDPAYRKVFLEKLRDILHPEDEEVVAPAVRKNPKARPRGSTTRNKSEFEHTLRKHGTHSTDAAINVQHLFDQMWFHFDGWVDVDSDGHCGFREITGFGVYKELFEAGVMGKNGLSKYENTLRRIRFTQQSGCGEDHWMHSDDLFVFASLFNWAIGVVAENRYAKGPKEWQCMIILPLRSSGDGVAPYGVLWILNHKSHWMRLHSRGPPDEASMPRIDPGWIVFREPSVQHLATLYKTNNEN